VAIDDLAIAAGEQRDLESELAERSAHAIYRGVVFPGITGVGDEALDGPRLDL
jgi:hypothetical protein